MGSMAQCEEQLIDLILNLALILLPLASGTAWRHSG